MKKSVLYLCAAVLALGLTACGGDSPEADNVSGGSSQGTEQTGNPDNGSGAAGEENTENSAAADGQQGDADDDDYEDEYVMSEEMTNLRAAAVEAVGEENYWPNMPMDPEMFQMQFGIASDMYDDYMAETPMIGTHVDTLIIIRAKDDQIDAVYDVMKAYRDMRVSGTMDYPMNLGKVQASKLEKKGNYIIFVQLGAEMPEDEEAAIVHCQEANQAAMDAILEKLAQ